jgi:hypothetical protein
MGKYTSYKKAEAPIKRGQIHPVMRGIGCILLAVIPLLSYGSAMLLVNYGVSKGWPIPPNWLGYPSVQPMLWKLQGLTPILQAYQGQTNLIANLVFAIAIAVVTFGFLSILYGFLYKFMGPSQYGPTDAPPIRIKGGVKRYKR